MSGLLFGVATPAEERGRTASSTVRKADFCGCNSPLSSETRSDSPLNESESRPRAPTTEFKPCFGADDWRTAAIGVGFLCDSVFSAPVSAKAVAARSARRNFINLSGDRLLSIELATTAAAALDSSANRDSLGNAATAFRLPPAIPIFRQTWLAVRAIALAFSPHQKCSIAIQDEHTVPL